MEEPPAPPIGGGAAAAPAGGICVLRVLDAPLEDQRDAGERSLNPPLFRNKCVLDVPGIGECVLQEMLGAGGYAQVFRIESGAGTAVARSFALKAMKAGHGRGREREFATCRALIMRQAEVDAAEGVEWSRHMIRTLRVSPEGERLACANGAVEERVRATSSVVRDMQWDLPAGTIVCEYVHRGDLMSYVQAAVANPEMHFSEALVRTLMAQLLSALNFMTNTLRMSHRDLKPENVAIDDDGNLKVLDFGMAVCPTDAVDGPPPVQGADLTRRLTSVPGHATASYMPLEQGRDLTPEGRLGVQGRRHTYDAQSADVWACGVIMSVLFVENLPFGAGGDGNAREVRNNHEWYFSEAPSAREPTATNRATVYPVTHPQRFFMRWEDLGAHFPEGAKAAIGAMLAAHEGDRPRFADIMQLPFFQSTPAAPLLDRAGTVAELRHIWPDMWPEAPAEAPAEPVPAAAESPRPAPPPIENAHWRQLRLLLTASPWSARQLLAGASSPNDEARE